MRGEANDIVDDAKRLIASLKPLSALRLSGVAPGSDDGSHKRVSPRRSRT